MLRLDRLMTLYCVRIVRRIRQSQTLAIPILMYHSVCDELESGHPYFWVNTSVKRFTKQMQLLKENNYKVISLLEAVERLRAQSNMCDSVSLGSVQKDCSVSSHSPSNPDFQNSRSDDRCVVLTFDDGFNDFQKHAWPILAELGFTATVFLATAFIGDSRKSFKGKECLTWSEVRDLSSHGISFGSHTVSHPKLYSLKWKDIRCELLESRLRLEDELQTSVCSFAYPYAFPQEDRGFVLGFRKELIDQGYLTAVTTIIGRVQQGCDPLCLKRLPVNRGDDERFFEAKLAGAYDWLADAQTIVRRMKKCSPSDRILERA